MQDGVEVVSSDRILLTYEQGRAKLHIPKTTLDDEADYICEAKNEAGVASTMAELFVESKPKMLMLQLLILVVYLVHVFALVVASISNEIIISLGS